MISARRRRHSYRWFVTKRSKIESRSAAVAFIGIDADSSAVALTLTRSLLSLSIGVRSPHRLKRILYYRAWGSIAPLKPAIAVAEIVVRCRPGDRLSFELEIDRRTKIELPCISKIAPNIKKPGII